MQLNSVAYNIKDDWDTVLLVTGDRSVRVGKSVFAMQIAAYLAYLFERMNLNKDAFCLDNIFFEGQKIMDEAPYKPPHSVIIFDEGREGLAAIKAMRGFQQDLIDFFTECGQLNHVFIIVLPDFFDLKEDMAVARSEFLVNVYRSEQAVMREIFKDGQSYPVTKFGRGFFEFYSKKQKRKLYDISRAKHIKSYQLVKASLPPGQFPHEYPVDEEGYKKKKLESLMRFKDKKIKQLNSVDKRFREHYIKLAYHLHKEHNYTMTDLGKMLDLTGSALGQLFKEHLPIDFRARYEKITMKELEGEEGKGGEKGTGIL